MEAEMSDFWAFRKMVTPVIIQILFWVGVIACLAGGIAMIAMGSEYYGSSMTLKGVLLIIFGPLLVRIYCEILIVFFRINETLTEIKHVLEHRGAQVD
jgi:hypothetical protein